MVTVWTLVKNPVKHSLHVLTMCSSECTKIIVVVGALFLLFVYCCVCCHKVSERGSLTSEEFAKLVGMSVLLAKERYVSPCLLAVVCDIFLDEQIIVGFFFFIPRLLLAEKMGHLCRDDSVEGLRFYPNLFMTQN